jgi:Lar family restriction alleviation protein
MTALSKILLPCPFCGGPAEMVEGHHNFRDVKVQCTGCGTEGPLFDEDDATSATVNALAAQRHWNTRVNGQPGKESKP